MIKKIESRSFMAMYLSLYSPKLNPIEQFWAIIKGRLKHRRLLTEEACNEIPAENLLNFASHT